MLSRKQREALNFSNSVTKNFDRRIFMNLIDAYNITTYLPVGEKWIKPSELIAKINEAVALQYGDYDQVAWVSASGTEQYRPLQGAKPTHGNVGEITNVESLLVEFNIPCDDQKLQSVIDVIAKYHPWEEPVIKVSKIKVSQAKSV